MVLVGQQDRARNAARRRRDAIRRQCANLSDLRVS